MSFEIQIAPLSHFELVRLIDTSTKTVIEIVTKGALLNSWQVMGHSKSMEIVEGNDFSEGWGDFEAGGFKGGKMSPFSCRIQNGQYTFEDKTYTIEKFYHEKHALHGILYDALFSVELTETDDQGAYLHLKYHYEATDKGFPFAYTVLIKWHLLKNNVVTAETIITNLTDSTIPMMDGWHPYFTLGGQVDQYMLEFQSNARLTMRDDMIPTGNMIQENRFENGLLIGHTHYDDCFLLDPKQNKIQLSYEGKSITVSPIHNYPYLQLYTPKDRKSIAIENLSGAPDCFNNKMGLQKLEPQGKIYFETSYQFKTTS